MRLLALFSIVAVSAGLIGCSGSATPLGSNGAPICLNAAQAFEQPVDTLVVTENLNRTSSWDLLQGIQPTSSSAEVPDMVALMVQRIDQFAAFEGPLSGITALNNPIDSMAQMIASGEAGNIQSGKAQMLGAIRDQVNCSYNNGSAILRTPDNELFRYILDYSYTAATNRLARTFAHYESVTDSEGETTTEIKATSLSALNVATFSTSGYNPPLNTVVQWGDGEESLVITKDYQTKADRVAYLSSAAFTLGSLNDIKRFRIALDYQTLGADIFVSDFVSAVTCHPGTASEVILKDPTPQDLSDNNCEDLEARVGYLDPGYDTIDGDAPTPLLSYTGTQVAERQ